MIKAHIRRSKGFADQVIDSSSLTAALPAFAAAHKRLIHNHFLCSSMTLRATRKQSTPIGKPQ
jgi:hypothetical protein